MKAKYVNPFTDFGLKKIFGQDTIFQQAFEKSEIAKYSAKERNEYEASLKTYRDYNNTLDTAFEDGMLEGALRGKLEGKLEMAKSLKENGVSMEIIIKTTGLSRKEIDKL